MPGGLTDLVIFRDGGSRFGGRHAGLPYSLSLSTVLSDMCLQVAGEKLSDLAATSTWAAIVTAFCATAAFPGASGVQNASLCGSTR